MAACCVQQCFSPYSIAVGLPRHSPIKDDVDIVIGRLLQAGLVRHWFLQSLKVYSQSQVVSRGQFQTIKTGFHWLVV